MHKSLLVLTVMIFLSAVINTSCSIRPFPCYNTDVPIDSIRAKVPVTFDASCTDSGREFFWDFNTPYDTFNYNQKIVTHTFDQAGTAEVVLVVVNGGKIVTKRDFITVRP